MNSKKNFLLFLLMSILTGTSCLLAQENCALNLKLAQDNLSTGQVESIPALIEPCIQSGFTREERVVAYKVLINSYIFDDNPEKAGDVMFLFLRNYPEYIPISTDATEFVSLIKEFDNRPRFSAGIIAGGTYSVIRPIESVSTSPIPGNYGNYKTSSAGYHAGLTFIKYLSSKIDLCVEADVKSTVFDFSINPDEFTTNSYQEFQTLVSLPVSATYTFGSGKYAPFARLGFSPGLLLSSGADLTSDPETPSPRFENTDSREPLSLMGIVGGGVKLKLSKSYIFLDVRYNVAFSNQVNNEGRNLTQTDEIWKYRNRDGNFYHDDLNFSLGFVKTIYKPRRIN